MDSHLAAKRQPSNTNFDFIFQTSHISTSFAETSVTEEEFGKTFSSSKLITLQGMTMQMRELNKESKTP